MAVGQQLGDHVSSEVPCRRAGRRKAALGSQVVVSCRFGAVIATGVGSNDCWFCRYLLGRVSRRWLVGLGGGEGDAVSVVMHSTGLVLSTPLVPPHGPWRAKVLLGPPNGPFESTVSRSDSRGPHQQAKKRWTAALLADHAERGWGNGKLAPAPRGIVCTVRACCDTRQSARMDLNGISGSTNLVLLQYCGLS